MSIFGTQEPKFISGGTTVLLDNAAQININTDFNNTVKTAEATDNNRIFINRPYHIDIEMIIWLTSYGTPGTKLTEILTHYNDKDIKFYRHRDGEAYKNTAGDEIDFWFHRADPFYVFDNEYTHDAIKLQFMSLSPVNLTQVAQPASPGSGAIQTPGGIDIQTPGGENIETP